MWLVGKGKLKIKIDQCRSDTPKAIVELIRRSTEFDREQRPEFSPEVCSLKENIFSLLLNGFVLFRSKRYYPNLNSALNVCNVRNQNHVQFLITKMINYRWCLIDALILKHHDRFLANFRLNSAEAIRLKTLAQTSTHIRLILQYNWSICALFLSFHTHLHDSKQTFTITSSIEEENLVFWNFFRIAVWNDLS